MFKNYVLVAYRNLLRNKIFSIINIAGLALGMTATLFLLSYVSFELSYDKLHDHLKDIYMVRLDNYKDNALEARTMSSFYAEAPAIKQQYPQVENYVRLHLAGGMLAYQTPNGETISHFEPNSYYADTSFFSVFSFPIINGDKKRALKSPNSMMMSESAAKKYFGNADPIGKVMKSTGWQPGEYIVEGIFKDVPENSHVQFDFLFAIENLLHNEQFQQYGWFWENFQTYLLLKPNTNIGELHAGINKVLESNIGSELKKTNSAKELVLVPLSDIHLYSSIAYTGNGNYQMVYFILIIACLTLFIAWLNYLVLSTAGAVQRAKEIGIRKVMGSERVQLIKQFLVESFFVSTIALVITGMLMVCLNGYFTDVVGKDVIVDLITQYNFWFIVAVAMILGIMLCGFYPGVVISSFQPIKALKGGNLNGRKGEQTRKLIVVFQFAASIVLIASTFVIREQIAFMHDQPTGFDIRQKLILRTPNIVTGNSRLNSINAFKNELIQHHTIKNVASSSEVPGKSIYWAKEFKLIQQADVEKEVLHVLSVDEDFLTTYSLSLLAGRNFSDKFPADFGGAVIVNETALRRLGISDAELAIDQYVIDVYPQRIIGVVKDYQQQSLKDADIPILMQYIPWNNDYFTISIESQNLHGEVDFITAAFKKAFPGNAVEYYFLDDFMNQLYKSDEQFWNVFRLFSALAIFISAMGLFGLSSYVIARRTKEIGIRKVLGSSVFGIVRMISSDYVRLVVFAFVIAVPAITFVMNQWLETFSHRINIPIWVYFVSGAIALLIAMLAISWQAISAASRSPVKTITSD